MSAAAESGFCHFVKADLADAFGHVCPAYVLACAEDLSDGTYATVDDRRRFREVMVTVLAGGRVDASRGILQGSPFSPLALNLVMHVTHDRPTTHTQNPLVRWVRYVDDFELCSSVESRLLAAVNCAEELVTARGFRFKSDREFVNLHEEDVEFLGVRLRLRDKRMTFRLTPTAAEALRGEFERLVDGPDSYASALSIARSWVSSYGMVPRGELFPVVEKQLRDVGVCALSSYHELQASWEAGRQRWDTVRNAHRKRVVTAT